MLKLCYNLILILYFSNSILLGESLLLKNDSEKRTRAIIRDTLFTLADHIIEIYLPEQKIYLHFRDGKVLEFLCSTGNPKLHKGVETPEGIFVIQNKARKIYSTQFDSTLMINWMGFNFNIGFHALKGKSYYKYLGQRVSSHGCVRISLETSKYFYDNISIGTPVIIHSGRSARVIAFADKNVSYLNVDKKTLKKLADENLKFIYSGMYLIKNHKLIISEKNLGHSGLELGDETKIGPQLPLFQNFSAPQVNRKLFSIELP